MRRLVASALAVVALSCACACSGADAERPGSAPPPTYTPTATSTPRATPTRVVYPTATPIPPAPVELTRVVWQGKPWYLHGGNLPWFNWGCDFGCGATGGASSVETGAAVSAALGRAKANGLNVVRWWMFPGEPAQFVAGANGEPAGLKPAVFADIDAALAMAERQDISYVFVLFSSPTALPAAWLTEPGQRANLAAVIGKLAERYKDNSRVMAWEVFNEPEWDIWGQHAAREDVVGTVKMIAAEVHARSNALLTVGSATIQGLGMWVGSGLDFYEPHWYDPMEPAACARCTDHAELRARYGLDKPVVIGEFFADASVDASQRYEDFYAKGYAGAWGWSLLPDHTNDKMSVDLAAAKKFADAHADLGPTHR